MVAPALFAEPVLERPARRSNRVATCYSVFDRFFPRCGFFDLTEGVYDGNPDLPFDVAQDNQIQFLLDEMRCVAGTAILDIGCGYGKLLARAGQHQACAVGITISPEQQRFCRGNGLDVHLLDYRDIGTRWDGKFDAVVANGSMEHFVQPLDAARGQADEIYREFFRTAHRMLNPHSASRRFVNTTIHFVRPPQPHDLMRSPFSFDWGSDRFHFALLARSFGGWYPEIGQLERCARGYFELVKTVDGTEDVRFTSEAWLRRVRRTLRTEKAAEILAASLPVLVRHPWQFATMLTCMLVTESWNWQFRGGDPPTRLLRQTWEYRDHPDA